ncbi:MAG: ABC transporter permease subunit [Deltaproteobacteria bacterium]|nr:ABC transporter permease subunit [Deltaproteobacteria bacterium]MBI2228999.1 ABC transporter permease subunit [Deltaproteobacteria bacterium]MBI2367398.1 ABC transporter permease subunit [Deltaproteobacteria bacterium]MBI2534840.1 ABC transporter permease subunit [Deltaproteobacteria bacterium]MBI3067320.1 ABC transporter permease subunit [Deltaproteobacteria bacterium]
MSRNGSGGQPTLNEAYAVQYTHVRAFPRLLLRVVGGSAVVETVFAYPGMGRLPFTSIMGNDFVVAMTVVMIIALMSFNLLGDALRDALDPKLSNNRG